MNNNQSPSTKSIIIQYLTFLALFIGTGFVSGAIVHTGNISEIGKYSVFGLIGLILFVGASFVQEVVINQNPETDGRVKLLFFSLLLSIGIGMVSGGMQHFTDFPYYSSVLIPLGLVLSYFAFLFKNGFKINKTLLMIGGIITVIGLPLYFGLGIYAQNISKDQCNQTSFLDLIKVNAGNSDHGTSCDSKTKLTSANSVQTKLIVNNDKSYIEYLIPHHQDAVEGSQAVLKTTQDSEFKAFLNNVIQTQGSEITLLKGYYKQWFGIDYKDNTDYQKMMKLDGLTGAAIDKTYIVDMLGHHSGIIDIAKSVLADTKTIYKPEIINLSKQIIKDQEADNIVLNKWLVEKYENVQIQAMDNMHTGH